MIRFGIIGTNWITERFIKAAKETEDFKLNAVYSRTEKRAKEFADQYNASHIYTDINFMAKSSEIDAVYIASPNSLHCEQAITMMNHGKHVLCEKPIASNTSELKKMITAAKENNVLLMEALKTTFLPNFTAVKDHLHKIGKVRRYFSSYCQYSSRYDAYKVGTVLNAFNPTFSNGSLMDIGIYCVYPMVVLFGKPQFIKATGTMLESGIDGQGSLLIQYEEMEAAVLYSKISNSYLPTEIQGENGSILIDQINTPEKVEIRYKDGSIENITIFQKQDSMYYEVKEFIELIKNGKVESPINSYAHSLEVMEILDEARKQMNLVFPADLVE
ncbi:Gfo/Idh/MocA family protein [Bacillus taeanensis]|uniref:Oxidoreductase n=1 Tax=Bacillus taeanensis TaxID=273032 RepID=A0A366Y3E2_9BACI|nr:Gfo/Idh/MocA family oxidoreductase [Bacillus taeanensis]RBW70923.1 oxidoreductase [Bacillus taeanensis]